MKRLLATICSPRLITAAYAVMLTVQNASAQEAEDQQDNEEEPAWSLSVQNSYRSKFVRNGIDMSNDQPATSHSLAISHANGFSFGVGLTNQLGPAGGIEDWTAHAGYELAVSEMFSLAATVTHTDYQNDSVNAIASLSNSLSLLAAFDLDVVDFSLSYEGYFGKGAAHTFGVEVSTYLSSGRFSFLPSLEASFISEQVDVSKQVYFKKKFAASIKTATVRGLSGITLDLSMMYDLGTGFTLSVDPAFVHSPQNEVSTRSGQFIWSVGIGYSTGF